MPYKQKAGADSVPYENGYAILPQQSWFPNIRRPRRSGGWLYSRDPGNTFLKSASETKFVKGIFTVVFAYLERPYLLGL